LIHDERQKSESSLLLAHLFDNFPFPMALIKKNGEVCMANRSLIHETGITHEEISAGKINVLNRLTNENYSVLEAVEDAFSGKVTKLRRLVYPLVMFCGNENQAVSRLYKNAVVFPAVYTGDEIIMGAVMLMK